MGYETANKKVLQLVEKSQAEIDNEESLRRAYRGTKAVCPYYCVDDAGIKFEIEQLRERQIIDFCCQSIDNYVMLRNSKQLIDQSGQMKKQAVDEAHSLINAVHKHCNYEPSWHAMKTIVQYTHSDLAMKRSVASDIFGVVANDKLQETVAITRFIQESRGNFEKPTAEQMCQVIDQKIVNEQQRKLNQDQERTR